VPALETTVYKVSNYYYYKQNIEERKIIVLIDNQQIYNYNRNTAYYLQDITVNNGWQLNGGSHDNVDNYPNVWDGYDTVSVGRIGNTALGNGTDGFSWHGTSRKVAQIFNYNDDGTLPLIQESSQWITGQGSYYATPEKDWIARDVRGFFPTIEPKSKYPKPYRYNGESWQKGYLQMYNGSKLVKAVNIKVYDGKQWKNAVK
jgi:hypothetical protein